MEWSTTRGEAVETGKWADDSKWERWHWCLPLTETTHSLFYGDADEELYRKVGTHGQRKSICKWDWWTIDFSQHLSKLKIKTVPREPLEEFAVNQTASWGPYARDFCSYLETNKTKSLRQKRAESLTFCVRPHMHLRKVCSPTLSFI